ncbi:DUF6417 family protein [Streptomyces sp. NBC_00268]|nr:DUF6417 family protein [Streptomyces sp. NBC_01764]MCX4403815.1 DUF6417 family protein [Streptomyces sp. NBC_01764]MCX5181234.1 DUF6417 family protein [Streptomyces sp. NBC_00268]
MRNWERALAVRWRLHLTQEQLGSVAYGLWLHRMTGSAAEANRFRREYGVVYSPARASGEGPPVAGGLPSVVGAATVNTGRP